MKYHPVIAQWMEQHKADQKRIRAAYKTRGKGLWWGEIDLQDLTERDLYRFKNTSDFLTKLEARGGIVRNAWITGKFELKICDEKLEFAIVEKMRREFRGRKNEEPVWTAYPKFHGGGLTSSGFLRLKVGTYCGSLGQPEWVEKDEALFCSFIDDTLDKIWQCAAAKSAWKSELADNELKSLERERRRQEVAEARRIEVARWERLRATSAQFHEAKRIRTAIKCCSTYAKNLRYTTWPDKYWLVHLILQKLKWRLNKSSARGPVSRTDYCDGGNGRPSL